MIIDSLRHWVREMHVDGFRFDLAAILSRDEQGRPMASPPLIWDIETDPVLANVKLIAEAWDAGGLYEVGNFVGDAWKEWNGKFRDDVRSFLKSDNGMARTLAYRLTGSPDIYAWEGREPYSATGFEMASMRAMIAGVRRSRTLRAPKFSSSCSGRDAPRITEPMATRTAMALTTTSAGTAVSKDRVRIPQLNSCVRVR